MTYESWLDYLTETAPNDAARKMAALEDDRDMWRNQVDELKLQLLLKDEILETERLEWKAQNDSLKRQLRTIVLKIIGSLSE